MHVAVLRPQRHRQRVVVGRGRAAVAADEAHRRSALALAGEVEEVADDHAEVVEVPVERLDVLGGLQDHVAEPLHLGGLAGRALRGVRPPQFVSEVEDVRRLRRAAIASVMCARDDTDGDAARVDQIDRQSAERSRAAAGCRAPVASASRSTSASSCAVNAAPTNRDRGSAAQDHARCARRRCRAAAARRRCAATVRSRRRGRTPRRERGRASRTPARRCRAP